MTQNHHPYFLYLIISIHTPARGVTLQEKYQKYLITDFNPHSRKGSDPKSSSDLRLKKISIHTPARGVTTEELFDNGLISISIHTPARGVTNFLSRVDLLYIISIHTPARGVTFPCRNTYPFSIRFQSTLPQGE